MTSNSKKEVNRAPDKGAKLDAKGGLDEAVIGFLKNGLESGVFAEVLIPVKVPAGDSYAWVLTDNDELFDRACVLPPIMPVQGAKALSSIVKHGEAERTIAVIMRPCEIRASIELSKLGQLDLSNIVLISIDCPGVLPLKDYFADPEKGDTEFEKASKAGDNATMRPVCQTCIHFGMTGSDIHIATFGIDGDDVILIPGTQKGKELLESRELKLDTDTSDWVKEIAKMTETKKQARTEAYTKIKEENCGIENLPATLDKCISCHNCMRVCPICYCRRCYFESGVSEFSPEQFMQRAEQKGSVRFSTDTLLFHIGRMSHMTVSCVSCGSCEDACPVSIPVAQVFGMVAEETQAMFDYVPGMNIDEPPPLRIFIKDDELAEVEKLTKDPLV